MVQYHIEIILQLASLRTTVATNTCSLYCELAVALGSAMDPFSELLLTNLLKMASFTKKITAQQSQAAVTAIITHTSTQPRITLTLLWNTLQEKTVQARAFVVSHFKSYIELHGARSKYIIDSSGGLDILEKAMKRSLADANVGVRENARVCFWVFNSVWPDRGLDILSGLDSLARKQLEKVCPDPEAAAALTPAASPKTTKKTSVAAAIAASRAKAKVIATAPPTLRHQATSASQRATSPSLRQRTVSVSPSSLGKRASVSPPSTPKSRILSNGGPMSRTVSSPGAIVQSHSRSLSSSSVSTPSDSIRRQCSSPLAGSPPRGSVFRQAIQTALPASPPRTTRTLAQLSPTSRYSTARIPTAVPVPTRRSTAPDNLHGTDSDLLLATAIPIPEDSDSDPEESVNLMSFSTPFELYRPTPAPKSTSQARSLSPKSSDSRPTITHALSTPEHVQDEIVEDALKARAEQAESAAERLLELVEPEDSGAHHSPIPTSLLLGRNGHATPEPKASPTSVTRTNTAPLVTPINRNASIFKQAALFKNSPASKGSPSLMDVLKDRKNETGWWFKRMTSQ